MSRAHTIESLGPPSLRIAGFRLWVHGREFPDSQHPDDGNWLLATAHCGGGGAGVRVYGAILQAQDISRFAAQCGRLQRGDTDTASLTSHEPNLRLTIRPANDSGSLLMRVRITPEHRQQAHRMDFEIDQSYLPAIVDECQAILTRFPVRE